jgi:hypothetical protein
MRRTQYAVLFFLMIFSIFISACDKIDLSKLSDEDLRRISEQAVVCNEPYMRLGTGCCLDMNDNSICDNDENLIRESDVNPNSGKPTNPNADNSLNELSSRSCPDSEPSYTEISPNSDIIYASYNHIFSEVDNPVFKGEAFYITYRDGRRVYIYSNFNDNPHDIANTQRKIQAIIKGTGSLEYSNSRKISVHIASKVSFNKYFGFGGCYPEHSLLSVEEYENLANIVLSEPIQNIELVYYKDLKFPDTNTVFNAEEIVSWDELSWTTGGSSNVFTIHFKRGAPLNIHMGTPQNDAAYNEDKFNQLISDIKSAKGAEKLIIAKSINYQEKMYTTSGVRSGWVAHYTHIIIE